MIRKFFWVGLLIFIILAFFGFFWWRWATSPVEVDTDQTQIFVIPQGQTAKAIGKRLQQQDLIKSQLAFKLLIDRKDLGSQLQAGDVRLSAAMDLNTVIESLAHSTLDYWIIFPEGLRVEEYGLRLVSKSAIDVQEFITTAKPFEGRLFPDTYLIPQQASTEEIVDILTNTFDKKIAPLRKDLATIDLSEKQIIILASLIEREAKHEQDRFLVSSVLHNRLQLGMALQIDATIQYAIANINCRQTVTKCDWWPSDITSQNLKINSPYNTYQRPGLPPAPIANPGFASLEAAVHPADTDYLYYVSDSAGNNHYAASLEGHLSNISEYLNQ